MDRVSVVLTIEIRRAYLVLAEVVWQIGNHDFGGGWNTVLWWSTLLGRARGLGVSGRSGLVGFGSDVGQRKRFLCTVGGICTLLPSVSGSFFTRRESV